MCMILAFSLCYMLCYSLLYLKKKSLPEILWVFVGKISYALELLSSLFFKK